MPLDFRYHIISITAVFMALILGIAIGVAIKQGDSFNTIIQGLEEKFEVLSKYETLDKKNNELITVLTKNLDIFIILSSIKFCFLDCLNIQINPSVLLPKI